MLVNNFLSTVLVVMKLSGISCYVKIRERFILERSRSKLSKRSNSLNWP